MDISKVKNQFSEIKLPQSEPQTQLFIIMAKSTLGRVIFYCVLSVVPQMVLFRARFFRRQGQLQQLFVALTN